MSSNMLAGERRWASARRGGMTVLGKVAVPKPLNLPSQRLENHGLDPSVEIVPKGTLSWGSRGSSSGSNAWTSSLSPNADGGSTSPSHYGGRPSSAGSGTRPSTAGSEKTHEPVASAWGSNSRPSSASGILTSSQSSSTVLRPRSAENRPNSSQLSRFAETISENQVAWGPSSTAERLGIKSSKEDAFSLTSGDFPTLGTEKDNSLKILESQDHDRPISASGRMTQSIGDDTNQADTKRAMVNTWRMDGPRVAEDGVRSSMENWQGEPPQFFNPNLAPQHFDAWRGPPVNGPSGVWYRGPPRGPPFGGPGGFPMEPFPYYRPIPPQGPQPVPPPGAGPRGPHLPTGELYRPHMHDSFARPGVPYRPSFYSGPPGPMNFDGYYGPPMGYCNNERDMPFMGMGGAPPVYGGYAGQNARDSGNSPARPCGLGITGKQMEAEHLEDVSGSKSVPHKTHGEWDRKEEGVNWEHNDQHTASHPGKSPHPMIASRKNEWGADNDGEEEDMFPKRKLPGDSLSRSFQYRDHTSQSIKVKSFESTGSAKGDDAGWTAKAESVATYPSATSQLPLAGERDALSRPASKDSALMQKIEGLNAKVRASDRRSDTPNAYNWEEQRNRPQIVDLEAHNNVRRVHGGQGRVDSHHGKGKFHNLDSDGWRRKPHTTEFSSAITPLNVESESRVHAHKSGFVGVAAENSVSNPAGKFEGESVAEASESIDLQAQRAKMRELAKQRALELLREEEERIKEQKAKAMAKLDELNRRTQAGEAANLIAERSDATSEIRVDEAESPTVGDPVTVHPPLEIPSTNLVSERGIADVEKENNNSKTGESVEETSPQDVPQKCVSEPNSQDGTANARNLLSQLNGGSRVHKQTGYKEKWDSSSQKSSNEKSALNSQKNHSATSTRVKVPVEEIKPAGESDIQNRSNTMAAPSTHHRKKVNKSTKNKNKLDETATTPLLPAAINPESEKRELSNWDIPVIEPDGWQIHEEPRVESPNRVVVANQWKPQPPRRMPRGQPANRYVDKVQNNEVIWAPVRTQHKTPDDSVDTSKKSTAEAIPAKSENVTHNNFKGKRAEMERYVPKPVAKELAQQGGFPPSSVSEESSDVVVEIKEGGDSSRVNNKQKKDHGQWKLRGTRPITPEPKNEIQQCREDDTGKDQGATGRGRKNLHRGHRDHQTELNHTDTGSIGASQWKPKSHPNHGNTETEINKHQKVQLPMETTTNSFPTQLVFGSIVADLKSAPPTKEEVPSAPIEIQNDNGSGRNGQNNRFSRGQQHKVPQRQNVQYEYHAVGPAKGGNPEGGVKGRGQSQPKRGGNYNRRQPGGVRIDAVQN